ncbi:CRISPR-associated endonuclease Cas2 [Candidatus Roizmanbacteria bacterium CG06_land_8_20_14_3_00_34_14]|uniref:CRISPR-associated endonuclease Cas2 n=2 Tax=Candidatus Roizmaniibacteriota TaxID=1752723 RepID=A0A2M7ATW3_9BACT|nr:MAG: CRISPR-associated endonuclease Cas2 [Candidatus Roizmanbacteria bacterium CG07_land_8_20_14_0_80_34_15]PIU74052.1 MAG: CRISPR-associated endonuclease Cas2 [Candidatus Roizmanbacteria bacterium CG06_land_8_20_14_3_00_34_14]
MSHKNIKYGRLMKGILMYFVDALVDTYSSIEARRGRGLSSLIDGVEYLMSEVKERSEKRKKILRSLKKLEKNEIIELIEKDDKVTVYLRDVNNPKIIEYSIKSILKYKQEKKRWNKKWFLVFFDVPEIQRNKRDYLRKFLKQLGFYGYQKSVYLFPYECEKEVELIKKMVEGAKYMKYIIAEKIEDENLAKKYFAL